MKKWLKILLFIFLGLVLVLSIGIGYIYYQFDGKFDVNEEKYSNYIGYIDQESALLNEKYELCGDKNIAFTYNGAAYRAYDGDKAIFRKNILSQYENKGYSNSGYLNFRFLVNCEGNAGWFEIIEMDLNLEETNLNENMVNQLLLLTSNGNHWNKLDYQGEPLNYYMYISYRIENGEIVEILP